MKKIYFIMFLISVIPGYAETQQVDNESEVYGQESPESNNDGRISMEELRSILTNAGITDEVVDEAIEDIRNGDIDNIVNVSSLSYKGYSIDVMVDQYANPNDRYVVTLVGAPSLLDAIIQSLKMRQQLELKSLNEITYNDFVVYTVLENMKIQSSYKELSPGFRQASYKCKLKKNYPDAKTLLNRFSNLKSKFPVDYTLDMINYKGTADNERHKTQTLQSWTKDIGEKQLQKHWENFLKQFKIKLD